MKKIFLLILAVIIFNNISSAQPKFTATISPISIGKDETAQLIFKVENAQQVQDLTAPDLKNFTIISGPNQQSNMQIINGVVKQSQAISYLIKPTSAGTFTIGEASAKVNGELMRSNKITLKVTKGSSPENKNPEKKNEKKNNNNNTNTNPNENFTFISSLNVFIV